MKTRQLLRTQKGAHLARRPAVRRQAALSALGALRVCATLRVPQSARAAEPKPSGDALRLNRGNRLHCNLVNGLPEAGPLSPSTRRLACGFSAAFPVAFVLAKLQTDTMPVNVKRGRHTARWGESLPLPGRQPPASLGMRSRLLATGVARSTQL